MCRSIAEGGQRCAAHARTAFEGCNAHPDSREWRDAAAGYASTHEGQSVLTESADMAAREQDFEHEARLRSAIKNGLTMREAAAEARLKILAATTRAPLVDGRPTRLVGDSVEHPGLTVFRPYDRRVNNMRYVQEGEHLWEVNKHGLVIKTRPSSVFPGGSEVDFADAKQAQTLKAVVREVDQSFKACQCC